jgi:hypothetical protein
MDGTGFVRSEGADRGDATGRRLALARDQCLQSAPNSSVAVSSCIVRSCPVVAQDATQGTYQ